MQKELHQLSEVRESILLHLEQVQTSEKLSQFLYQMRNYEARLFEQHYSRQFQASKEGQTLAPGDQIQQEFDKSKYYFACLSPLLILEFENLFRFQINRQQAPKYDELHVRLFQSVSDLGKLVDT